MKWTRNPLLRRRRVERAFDPSAYESRMVALKVAYFGFKYQGFMSQTGLLNILMELARIKILLTQWRTIYFAP